jgi:hypothetical protein
LTLFPEHPYNLGYPHPEDAFVWSITTLEVRREEPGAALTAESDGSGYDLFVEPAIREAFSSPGTNPKEFKGSR